jgi:uncharacterized membrane protein
MTNWAGIIGCLFAIFVGFYVIVLGANTTEYNPNTNTKQISNGGYVELLVGIGIVIGGLVGIVKSV